MKREQAKFSRMMNNDDKQLLLLSNPYQIHRILTLRYYRSVFIPFINKIKQSLPIEILRLIQSFLEEVDDSRIISIYLPFLPYHKFPRIYERFPCFRRNSSPLSLSPGTLWKLGVFESKLKLREIVHRRRRSSRVQYVPKSKRIHLIKKLLLESESMKES